ncbi:hypothetical protein ACH41E_25090 [Streptomyces sp. NPDC020412]|uniref:hypothetical protein n=1 Tax=Streptomyces sp. NPDC020412 TaxID=3365073 RepID=UPI00378F492D
MPGDDVRQGAVADIEHITPVLARAAIAAALHNTYDGADDGTGTSAHGLLLPPATAVPVAHPNGFLKLPLARVARDGRRLFLHIWAEGAEDAEIHDHRWDFASTVLRGALDNTVVDIAPQNQRDADGYRVVHYRPRPGGYRFAPAGDGAGHGVVVTSRRTETLAAGARYRMTASALHHARALPGTVTLIARGAPLRDHARVLARGSLSERPTAWRAVDAAERRRHLDEAYAIVAGPAR